MEQCKNLHYLVEELIKVGHLKQYVHAPNGRDEKGAIERAPPSPTTPRAIINYIHGGLVDDKYYSQKRRRRLVHAVSIKKRVHTIQCTFTDDSVRPIDRPITFSPINSNWVILSHEGALVLTLVVNDFDVHRILVDPGSSADLLQMSVYRQIRYFPSALENPGRIFTDFNGASIVSLDNIIIPV
ncbi:uncharacterized protein LOC117933267 [Vitis riparia]|uniref:uncharacterized protein LOC117933267 n=1 Tax=Vitis riparia TaxID=96939 RepID=UPI00155B3952|nr:uncharacterized protein LOC117933267 [Vitis riparia]